MIIINNEKSFNLFIFLSTFARNLVDVFIPIILYKRGLSADQVLLFLGFNYLFSFILNIPLAYIASKITFKWLLIGSSIFIGSAYYYILIAPINLFFLTIALISHVINAHSYWLSRHYYALDILPEEDIGKKAGNIVILSQLSLIPASYLGALIMHKLNMQWVLIIVIVVYLAGTLPLFFIKEPRRSRKINFLSGMKETFIHIPKRSFYFFIFAQFRFIGRYLFPLYLFIYVKNNYEYIGVFNIAVGLASIFFVYIFARYMDKNKKDYLIWSGLFSCLIWFFKLNVTTTTLMLIIGFLEGLVEKMYETSFNRDIYALGKHYKPILYASTFEGLQNIVRVVIIAIFFVFIKDLTSILYISTFMLLIAGIIGFNDGISKY